MSTIKRHISALVYVHSLLDVFENPAKHPLVIAALSGAARIHGRTQKGVKPLLIEDLRRILDLPAKTVVDHRNRALLALGFAGGFRRSELISLNVVDIENYPDGIKVNLRKSKTDQEQIGRSIGIPFGRGIHCPVRLLLYWLSIIGGEQVAVFTSCAKGERITERRLSGETVATVVKSSVAKINLDPTKYSGHSLRVGFVTSAIAAGVRTDLIRKQTGHKSDHTMARYIREGNLFSQNAASALF